MFVFREGRRAVCAQPLLDGVVAGLKELSAAAPKPALLDALLRVSELECALADRGSRHAARIASVTDALAAALVSECPLNVPELADVLACVQVPETISVSPPEGFTYYALHPLNFSDMAAGVRVEGSRAAVIGIRSIGTTLSAIVKARLEQRGLPVERITVRPHGHPFDRVTQFTGEQLRWIRKQRERGAHFLVVDEGPGLSGSSFLSVGEALLECRVPSARIAFLCSRCPDPASLVARDAPARWPRFNSYYVQPNDQLPEDVEVYVAGGIWRAHFIGAESEWPASWTQTERLKFLSRDRRRLYKFEGLGRFGAEVYARSMQLAASGFGPRPQEQANGFVAYPVVPGRILRREDLSTEVLDRMARYCAFRATEFRVQRPPTMLHPMLQFNASQEFGVNPDVDAGAFVTPNPIITDSHLLPHEWLQTADGQLLKLDGVSHGDDHFYPGPTDIAWDLAGAIVEWEMPPQAQEYFLERYRKFSGDDARPRLRPYLLAYTMFRLGFSKMAAEAMRGSDEAPRLVTSYRRYRAAAQAQLRDGHGVALPVGAD
jgi:hypothetical protein